MEIKDMLNPHVTLALDGKAIKALRKRADLTQRELAEAMGVIPKTIRHWEADDRHPQGDRADPTLAQAAST
jgi:DNA-binding transcriptional regulator YiaG